MIDFSCELESCNSIATDGIYCHSHRERVKKFGTPTPMVTCFGCHAEFCWIGPAFNYQRYCNLCIEILLRNPEFLRKKNTGITAHGITVIDFLKMLEAQGYSCKICGRTRQQRRLNIDHDHKCCPGDYGCRKCVRGLVCGNCNYMIGMIENRPELVEIISEYLSARKVLT